jgi:hypothetical protein
MPFSDDELVWPEKAPDAILGYALDLSVGELDPGDSVTSASVSISPSGDPADLVVGAQADVVPLYVTPAGVLTVWFKNGVPGRIYLVRVLIDTVNKARISLMVSLPIVRTLASYPPPEPVQPDFTQPVDWFL